MKNQIKPEEITARREKLMLLQQEIHNKKQKSFIGQIIEVMVDMVNGDGTCTGRTASDAPDVDGMVLFSGAAQAGTLARVLITGASEYDLQGTLYE
jgi:ribosomal protein S12 methylthiotransferase